MDKMPDFETKKALVLDIDGTLLNSSKEITPKTAEAIRQVMLAGHAVVIASGRPLPGMKKCGLELELEKYGGYLLSYNGAKVINCRTGEVIYEKTLPANVPAEIYEYARAHGAGVVSFEGDCVISAFEPNEYVKMEAKHNGLDIRVVPNFPDYIDFPVNKCMIMDHGEKDALYEKELREKYGDSLSIFRSEEYFLEIMHSGISKADSLDAILDDIGVKRENTICCGDSYNDISMISYAGIGVAMGNAKPEVKAVADYITGTNDEDGLVEVINRFILNDKKMIRIEIPEKAKYIIDTLEKAGYEAYVVGGCVRDSILGRVPQDWDITTSALPLQVKELFRRTIDTGLQHGTVTVMLGDEGFEVTTYRIDGKYEDGRHPKEVTFTPNLEEDLLRRDFTINAMAYNDRDGLVDLYDGIGDIKRKTIRCVGSPVARFGEDALRMLRAVRFSAQLGYAIESETKAAIKQLAGTLDKISAERIRTELVKLIVSDNPYILKEAYETGMTSVFFPEFDRAMETEQNHIHHCYSVGEHILHSVEAIEPDPVLRMAMLLHDIGKPDSLEVDEAGVTHFHGHPAVGEKIAGAVLRRLKFDNDTIDKVCRLVRYHDYGNGVTPDARLARRAIYKLGDDLFPMFLKVRTADVMAQSMYQREEKLANVVYWSNMYDNIKAENQCVSLKMLKLNGRDLIEMGVKPGPVMGEVLGRLLDEVLDEPSRNDKDWLKNRAAELINS